MKFYGVLTILLVPALLVGQANIFGYFESEFDRLTISDQSYNYGYNKLRLDLDHTASEGVTFGANINIQRYYGNVQWNLLDFLPGEIWESIFQPLGIDEFPLTIADTLYLDNAYLRIHFNKGDVTIGKQQISLGVGYAWNPLDIFNTKILLDPTYEQTGVNGFRFEIPIKDRGKLDFIISPGSDWKNSTKMITGKLGFGRFDLIGTIGSYNWQLSQLDLQTFQSRNVVQERLMTGGALVGELAGIGIWGEGAYNTLKDADNFTEVLVGVDYTFENGLYCLAEFYYNGNASENSNALGLDNYIQYLNGETHSLLQTYTFLMWQYPLSDFVSVGMINFASLSDKSAALNPQLEWNAFEDVSISVLIGYYIGDENTEFGLQDWNGRIRVRAYF
jgi:hypothetical protein